MGETQNFGLLDTRAAIEWIRNNAEAFGGDPTKIVLGGRLRPFMPISYLKLTVSGARRVCWSR